MPHEAQSEQSRSQEAEGAGFGDGIRGRFTTLCYTPTGERFIRLAELLVASTTDDFTDGIGLTGVKFIILAIHPPRRSVHTPLECFCCGPEHTLQRIAPAQRSESSHGQSGRRCYTPPTPTKIHLTL
jgi:hypothetical protein